MPEALTQPATLLIKLHGKSSQQIELTHKTVTIGRKADNTLAIDDPAVSGHHARIVKIQAVFFLEDLKSTNGTAINGQPITRHQLQDTDVITIGQHRIVFQEQATAGTMATPPSVDVDRTIALTGSNRTAEEPSLSAKILVVAGKTDRLEYSLGKHVSLIGSQDGAAIRLTGWFAPKSAARIAQRGQNYAISPSQGTKSLLVNGTDVVGQQILKDGDQIEVAGVRLTFYLLSGSKQAAR